MESFATTIIISLFLCIGAGQAVRIPLSELTSQVSSHNNGSNQGYHKVATIYPFGAFAFWEAECFQHNNAYLTFTQDFGLGYVVLEASDSKSWTCVDYYEFKVEDQTIATESVFQGVLAHEVSFDSQDRELRRKIKEVGVSIYVWSSNGVWYQKRKISGLDLENEVEKEIFKTNF